MGDNPNISYFAETDARNKRTPFGIKADDRSRHTYLIGKTGMGKSTVLENMTIQDIQNGNGLAFLDPHGKTADLFLEYIPEHRIKDVIYFAPFDTDFPISFNVMEDVGADKRHLVSNGLMSAFKKIWVDAWSARMEYILNNIMLALLEYPGSTLVGVNRMLADKDYRKKVVDNITDPSVKAFWTDEFAKYGDKYMQEAGAAIQNKIGQFIANPLVRNIIGQPKSNLDIRKIMDEKKILIINLSKGRMGESNANLLGSMIITKIYLAAMSRADSNERELASLPNFYLYVDEFQNFANESFADILSEARKYKLNLTVAHQYIEQMSEEVRAAVFGNVGTMIAFRVGAYDAEVLEKEFAPQFTIEDLVSLGRFQIYLKLMIDGVTSAPFSASTLPQIERPIVSYVKEIIDYSRATYARPRALVEDDIKAWHAPVTASNGQSGVSNPKPASNYVSTTPSAQINKPATPQTTVSELPKPTHVLTPRTVAPVTSKPPEAKPKEHQPFKEVFSKEVLKEQRETDLRKAMSLDYLKPERAEELKSIEKPESIPQPGHIVKNVKTPTAENVGALKEALSHILKQHPVRPEPKHEAEYKKSPTEEPIPHAALEEKKPTKEIPEEVLKKVLNSEARP